MFGRYSGASWVKKQHDQKQVQKAQLIDDSKSESKLMKPNSRVRSDTAKLNDKSSVKSSGKSAELIEMDEIKMDEIKMDEIKMDEITIKGDLDDKSKFEAQLIHQEIQAVNEMIGKKNYNFNCGLKKILILRYWK